MDRVNVFEYATEDEMWADPELPAHRVVGWFDADAAERFSETTTLHGENQVSVVTMKAFEHERLYRTRGGRWAVHAWSQWQGSTDRWIFVTPDRAREWLILCGHDDAVAKYFGGLAEESGPNLGGRPAEGRAVNVRIPEEHLDILDQRATAAGTTRAALIRDAVAVAITR